ncbi:YhbY family RNA-binding protein [Acidianus hospitalis]|jgi:Predicted RNA-binding protein containing KH domain, possibly ribosomal protein|uniref:RNA-binding protein n=1 Tax=Acidianus hospitalis TaxID=563177 RepID=A0A2T9X8M0_9CREN|nr:YhbY family RNA-binding protein [Acidianus hospitalis]PVU76372.1 RNA-binding protein [Acidianus hospitalis]
MISEKIKKTKAEHPTIRIGKNGLTEGLINEIKRQLKDNEVVKIRIGIKDQDRREIAKKVAELTNAKLVEVRGYTFILMKNE